MILQGKRILRLVLGTAGVLVNAFFVVLWVLSALLFGRATAATAGSDAGAASEPD